MFFNKLFIKAHKKSEAVFTDFRFSIINANAKNAIASF
ncbi:hypothetical protein GGR22_002263 [Flavobacterium gossypii]|uniref:Uncharacterized protein n=1 Tax=Flavobacterium gossypii TaxID=1646119 RepID=A0ABR6DQX8_9FLAO|nr:hypothetical protein [Flavobacterium gossypii]